MKKGYLFILLLFLAACAKTEFHKIPDSQEFHQDTIQSSLPVKAIRLGFTSLPVMHPLAELPGGHISDIKFSESNPNILYLASNVNAMGLWKSTDTGETWQRVYFDDNFGGTHMNSVVIDPRNADTVLAIDVHGRISKGVKDQYRQVKDFKVSLFGLALDSSDPKKVYIGTEEGKLWKSTDEGETWSELSSIGDAIGPIVAEKEMIYVGTRSHGLFVSRDGGKSWINEYKEGEVMKIAKSHDILFLATSLGVLRKDLAGQFETVIGRNTRTVVISPSNPMVVYAGTADDGVYKSTDGGTTWVRRSDGIQNLDVGTLAINPTNPDSILSGTNIWQWSFHGESFPSSTLGEGIYKTIDGGNHWRKIEGNFYDRDVDTIAVDPNNYNNIYLGTECSRGVYRSLDGGKSFEFISGGPEEAGSFDIAHYTMRMVTDTASNIFLTGRFGITKSSDYGKTWSVTGVRRHYHGIGVSSYDANLVIAGTSPEFFDPAMGPDNKDLPGAQIVRSGDGGKTWQVSEEGFPAGTHTSLHDVAFDINDPNVVYVTTTHEETGLPPTEKTLGVYKSTDQGKSWHAVNSGLTSLDVDTVKVSPHKKVFAGTMDGLFVSGDGEKWSSTSLKHKVESIVIDPFGTVFVGTTEYGVFASFDDGVTWKNVEGVPHKKIIGLAYSQGYLFVAVNDVGVFRSD